MDTFNLFDDEVFQDIYDESVELSFGDLLKYNFGDLLVYNKNKHCLDIMYKQRQEKDLYNKVIGIIIKQNDDNELTIDIMLKNFLTTNGIIIPYTYMDKPKNMIPYIYLLFNRYCNKLKRLSNINIDIFNFYIPYIAQLDYIFKNIDILYDVFEKTWDNERLEDFKTRLYDHGVICQHKGKYYQWIPVNNLERQINHLDILKPYEFLPMFTLKQ